jgi:hypothetical protein
VDLSTRTLRIAKFVFQGNFQSSKSEKSIRIRTHPHWIRSVQADCGAPPSVNPLMRGGYLEARGGIGLEPICGRAALG